MTEKFKSIILPIAIIVVGVFIGGAVIFTQQVGGLDVEIYAGQSFRQLSFKAPGMFCVGCTSNIEGYLGSIDGVQSVSASLDTKEVDVVYDPSIVDKDTILSNQVLDIYGRDLLSDEEFTGDIQIQESPATTDFPEELSAKLQKAGAIVLELDNKDEYDELFGKINEAVINQDFQEAEKFLDEFLANQ